MGSTVVLLLASGTQAMVAHAGDSRAYLFRDNQLVRLTKDHSVVQRMVDDHIIAPEQAEGHPNANQLTRALGLGLELGLEISEPFTVQPGDIVLLCSDGLSGFVNDEAISQAIRDGIHPQKIADRLVDLALAAGGEDNVSVQLIKFEARAPVVFLPPRRLANRGRLVAMLLALFGLAAAGTVLYFGGFLNRVGSRGHAETKTAHEPLATKSAPSEPPPNKSSKKQPSNVAPPPRLANENTSRPERPTGRGRGAEGTDEKQQEELIITPRDDQKPDSAPRKPAPSLQQPNFLLVLPLGGQIRDWAHSSAVIVCDKLPKGDTVYYCNDGDLGECLKGLRDLLKQDVTHLRVEKVSQAPTLLQCIEAQGRALQDYVAVILRPKKGKI
jgi:hypothetical protein